MIVLLLLTIFLYFLFNFFGLRPARNMLSCGLAGFSGSHPVDITKMRWLLLMNQPRGRDSTGIFSVKNNKSKESLIYKNNVDASKFIMDQKACEVIRGAFTLIGHTRMGTKGASTKENAHPFQYDLGVKIVGAHNGFISDSFVKRYIKEYELEETFPSGDAEVDSQILFAVLSKMGGDYSVLPKIEGGIVTLFMAPEKYKDTLFAYKRAARDLHYGLTAEGIYINSEKEPLEIIGCHKIESFDNDSLTILKGGQILDSIKLSPPDIYVPLNQGRNSFGDSAAPFAKEKYKEELPIVTTYGKVYNTGWKGKNRFETGDYSNRDAYDNFTKTKSKKDVVADEEKYHDRLNFIIKNCIEEIESISPENIKELIPSRESDRIEIEDLTDGLVFIELTEDVQKTELAAWTVFDDKSFTDNCSITGVNGVCVLRYKEADCGAERTLKLYDPIDGALAFTFKCTPKAGRVLEVALQIPFQKKKNEGSTESEASRNKRAVNSGIFDVGTIIEDKLPNSLAELGLALGDSKDVTRILRQTKDKVHCGYKKEEADGEIQYSGSKSDYDISFKGVSDERNRTFTREEINSITTILKAKLIMPPLPIALAGLNVIKNGEDYKTSQNIFKFFLDDSLKVEELLEDAALMKANDALKMNSSRAIMYYAILLLDYCLNPEKSKYVHTNNGCDILVDSLKMPWSYFKIKTFGTQLLNELRVKQLLNAIENGKLSQLKSVINTAEVGVKNAGKLEKETKIIHMLPAHHFHEGLSITGD